ncbi:MAG: MBL fold metallo-hydrolase [Myxococcales bacterium]|nr:MBL fold metallo-hydrolase [Myxococcales bacterium]
MQIQSFFDTRTYTMTYVVFDPKTHDAVVIDPVLDYEPVGSKVFTESVENVVRFIEDKGLKLHAILETHAHADHLSGSQVLKRHFPGAQLVIGRRITEVQRLFKRVFDLPEDFPTDGRQFDHLLDDGEIYQAGTVAVRTVYTPGHTPACASYLIDDALFTGDALFMPDQGTGRCDFPGGSATDLYRSITERIYDLPDETRIFVGHDYQPGGRAVAFESTVAEQKATNTQLPAGMTEKEFVERRTARDVTLAAPKLLYQSVQVNVDAGALPRRAANEMRYLKIPVNVFRPKGEGALVLDDI